MEVAAEAAVAVAAVTKQLSTAIFKITKKQIKTPPVYLTGGKFAHSDFLFCSILLWLRSKGNILYHPVSPYNGGISADTFSSLHK